MTSQEFWILYDKIYYEILEQNRNHVEFRRRTPKH